ncbi:Structural maintenance of chromosomes protein 5 [Pleosporales sp. CAS-2024a]
MPGLVQSARKRPSHVISDDDENEQSDRSSVSVGSKRARHARDASGSATRANGHDQNDDISNITTQEEFPPGTLVRVKLQNFVTYTAAEFHLGPSLNMIIGPNGTGKSTLVCAICLGLGWSSEHLGRAKELGHFVKNGSEEALIEIELAAGPGMKSNPIVKRMIRKSDGKSIFWINDKNASKNAVLSLCKQFSIQIDNLCQFLPQDRVVEFARMTDVDRLRETQRAAAPRHMVEWHNQLKELRTEEKALEVKLQNEQRHLEGLEAQQNRDKDDVERFQQREGLIQKSRCLQRVRPIIELSLRQKDLHQAKKDLQTARRELDQINSEVQPIQQAQDEMVAYKDKVEEIVKLRQNRFDVVKRQADQVFAKMEQEKEAISGFTSQIKAEIHSKKDREKDIARINAEIQRLERQRQDQPVTYDAAGFEKSKTDLGTQIRAAMTRQVECEATMKTYQHQGATYHREYRTARAQRDALDTQSGKQAGVLSNLSRETAQFWDWIVEHKATLNLKGEVYGPPILECSIRDNRYADAVESQLKKGDFLAITCTHPDDQKLLSDERDKLRLHDIFTRTSPKARSEYHPPAAPAALHALGFEGYIGDYIEGPDAVLAMLCDNARLHSIAYASSPITDAQHDAVSSSPIRKWVSGRDIYQITTRREYGVSSTSVTQLRQARCFVDQPANSEEKRQLDDTLEQIKQDVAELQEKIKTCKTEIVDLKQKQQDLKQARDEIQEEQDRTKRAVAEWRALPDKIKRKKDELDKLDQDHAETNNRIRDIKAASQQASLAVANTTIHYAKIVIQLRSFHECLIEAEIRLIEAKSELNALRSENGSILEKLQNKQVEIQELDKRNTTLRNEFRRLTKIAQDDINSLPPEEKAMVSEYRQLPSLEALELEVQAVSARLDMMVEGNSGIIKAYEKRKEDIVKTQEKLDEYTTSLEHIKTQITEIRAQWEPELDALVSKISDAFAHNFQQIGCAGEVSVNKDEEDFDKWSIQISVRFREGETLAVLNAQRQSGGERAVSTIFYLMAMQDLAQSPFRVVDEINQGMDPRNERMVHERMVDIACQERTSQYFLVTPKLLTGLKFHPRMKVHIINSGEHVPDAKAAKGTWNMREFAKMALRTRKGINVP